MSNTPSEQFLRNVIALCTHKGYSPENIEAWDKDDKWIADLWREAERLLSAPQPVVRGPLTDAQIAEMMRDTWGCASIAPRHAPEFARTVERAHGITQKGGSNAE